jgi:hypothetical protein
MPAGENPLVAPIVTPVAAPVPPAVSRMTRALVDPDVLAMW